MGLELLYEDNKEIIPAIQQQKLEYDISTKIKILVDTNKETLALAKTGGQEQIKMRISLSYWLNATIFKI